jgi:ubiquinone/menaquinone biosynthesis C-methylase UbiE
VTAAYVFAFLAVFSAAWTAWRISSRRRSLPCPVWLRWLVEMENPFARVARSTVVVSHLDLEPGMSVLDLGCGPGRLTLPIARAVGPTGQVIAADIQEGMLERVRKKAQAAGLHNIRCIRAAAGAGELGPMRVDRAVLAAVLGEIPDRPSALREIAAVLKPGAVLSITELVFDPHYQSRSAVLELARAAGFRERATYGNRMAYTLNLECPGDI